MRIYTIIDKTKIVKFLYDIRSDLKRWDGNNSLVVTIEDKKEKRTTNQNSLYWKWLTIISENTGHDIDEIHEFCRYKFLGIKVIGLGEGMVAQVPKSTKSQNTKEMSEYMEKIQSWALSYLNIILPSPDDERLNSLETR